MSINLVQTNAQLARMWALAGLPETTPQDGDIAVYDGSRWVARGYVDPTRPPAVLTGQVLTLDFGQTQTWIHTLTMDVSVRIHDSVRPGMVGTLILTQDQLGGHNCRWGEGFAVSGSLKPEPDAVTVCEIVVIRPGLVLAALT